MPDDNEPIIPDGSDITDPDDSSQIEPVPDDTEPEVVIRRTTSCYVRVH